MTQMGTISKWVAKNGGVSWQGKARRKGHPTQTKTFREKRDCENWIRATETALDRGAKRAKPKADGLNTLADVLRRYRETVCPEHRGGAIEILSINKWLREPDFVKTPLSDVTASFVATWRDERLKEIKPGSRGTLART
ncbi:putative plasmid recombinase [Burkholderia lata]|uniref:Putative plasmid recombinase n=1 Tax=Burkholderia lata (strain ATCC 17760 / DSM 23089 / LMG 22485 / NCIMB 9086 / R18194 / 383) TaxID=482957 RepID=A0A6P2MPE0_BURL3|nr:hypothetical protein [Burkholderia lata]VWB82606.1 putative plasmid recombinase [Burkholderia lata]